MSFATLVVGREPEFFSIRDERPSEEAGSRSLRGFFGLKFWATCRFISQLDTRGKWMEILGTKTIYVARVKDRPILSLHERQFQRHGRTGSYFMVACGDDPVPHAIKRPDAVVIVAFHDAPNQPTRLVLNSEYRIPIDCREISFPAGLIDAEDYKEANGKAAVCRAAVREMKEETGLDFVPTEVSPLNLYSSAGMTNESVCYVIGHASGEPTTDGNEATEDIEVLLWTRSQVVTLIDDPKREEAISKTAWPFLWSFKYNGFPGQGGRQ